MAFTRHVTIPEEPDDQPAREIYGRYRWEDAYYVCPHCAAIISDDERVSAIRRAAAMPPHYGWLASADSTVAGFYANELMSVFDGSRVPILARKFLEAQSEMDEGKPEAMIVFHNSTLGLPWEYKGELPEEDELRDRAEPYAEWTSPIGALIALLSIDVQHDRLALTCWVVGRGEEMWLAYWGEIYGQTVVAHAGAWLELEQILGKQVHTAYGSSLSIAAVAIDCSDGQTSEASYSFVRKHHRRDRQVLALKGAADDMGRVEIWTPPKAIDPNNRATKASRFGVQIHSVGTAKAKDLILGWAQEGGRIRLTDSGAGRMHWYQGVRDDFYEQMLSEIKIPSRTNPRRRSWKARTDRRNEALDCAVYAVYLSRHLRLHLRRPAQWDMDELRLRQGNLISPALESVKTGDEDEQKTPPPPAKDLPVETTDDNHKENAVDPDTFSQAQAHARLATLLKTRHLQRHGR